jgi:NADPH-dependent curcumin reductase CurA
MNADQNLCVALARRPEQTVSASDFMLVSHPMPQPGPGQLLVRSHVLSLDPYMASAIQGRHMSGAIAVGDVMPGELVGTVALSRHPDFAPGDLVVTRGGWRSWCVVDGQAPASANGLDAILAPVALKISPVANVPASAYLGVLGMPGLTAYALMLRCLRPGPGDTCLVFAATGAVGSAAGQIARHMGAHTVAYVGSREKARHAREVLGFDAAVVRTEPDALAQLAHACPAGIDALVTNDCGAELGGIFGQLARGARVALTGAMSQYNSAQPLPGPSLGQIIARRASVSGFVVFDHYDLMQRWRHLAASWMADGKLRFHEDRSAGLAQAPAAFTRLMRGETMGKALVVLDQPA